MPIILIFSKIIGQEHKKCRCLPAINFTIDFNWDMQNKNYYIRQCTRVLHSNRYWCDCQIYDINQEKQSFSYN